MKLDPRVHAYRDDVAAASLQNRVRAQRYVEGEPRQVAAPSLMIRLAPKFDAPAVTEALSGELATLYDMRDGWGWLQLASDGYVGYATMDGLSSVPEQSTHKVAARLTHVYPAPDMKRPPFLKLAFGAEVAIIGRPEGRFVELSRGGFVFADHLVGVRERVKDYVRVAERFVGAPYLWGGKTVTGVDCSGLVQLSLQAGGLLCPRDSDMQAASVGEPLDVTKLDAVQRGDLLFWQGHVAIAQSPDWMLHASGHHMEVVVEPIRRAIERIAETHGPLTAIRRPSFEVAAPAVEAAKPAPAAQPQVEKAKAEKPQPEKAQPERAQPEKPKPADAPARPKGSAAS
jgi:cell wall-associated NlpC family hydrolase